MYFKPGHISIHLSMNNFKSIALFRPDSFDEPFYNTSLHHSRSSHSSFFINIWVVLNYSFT